MAASAVRVQSGGSASRGAEQREGKKSVGGLGLGARAGHLGYGEATTRTDDVDPCWRDELASTQAKVVKDYGFSLSSALFVIAILKVSSEVATDIMVKN